MLLIFLKRRSSLPKMLEQLRRYLDMNTKKPLTKAELEALIEKVYASLREKGYNPTTQIAGYILSEDPVYMPDWNNARGAIQQVDRDDLLNLIIDYYLENRFDKQNEAENS